ncbi:hypothetical protein [Erysipelothrix aquatica]|uniref:hypothetical protein n=1 Tax=Erysipelothrix aquatica TaxID=2683714 RepID=UPI001358C74C|nr:hypothetical protein [Erysipelothrix aquatica]
MKNKKAIIIGSLGFLAALGVIVGGFYLKEKAEPLNIVFNNNIVLEFDANNSNAQFDDFKNAIINTKQSHYDRIISVEGIDVTAVTEYRVTKESEQIIDANQDLMMRTFDNTLHIIQREEFPERIAEYDITNFYGRHLRLNDKGELFDRYSHASYEMINAMLAKNSDKELPLIGTLVAEKNGERQTYTFSYNVRDSQPPIITGPSFIKLEPGESLDLASYFTAKDPIEGDKRIAFKIIDSDFETGITYYLAETRDLNNNSATHTFTVEQAPAKTSDGVRHENLVLHDRIIIPAAGPLGVGRIIDLEASNLDPADVSIAYETRNNEITLFSKDSALNVDTLRYDSYTDCTNRVLKVNKSIESSHYNYLCGQLSNGDGGATVLNGAGGVHAFIKAPNTDTIVINIKGVKHAYDITYYRYHAGSYKDIEALENQ